VEALHLGLIAGRIRTSGGGNVSREKAPGVRSKEAWLAGAGAATTEGSKVLREQVNRECRTDWLIVMGSGSRRQLSPQL